MSVGMTGRNYMVQRHDGFRDHRDAPWVIINRGGPAPGPVALHPAALQEELELQYRENQRIISQNALVIDDNTHLQRELTAAKDEIHRLGSIIPSMRELTQRGLKHEAELRAAEPIKADVKKSRAEVKSLNVLRQELDAEVKSVKEEVKQLEAENQQISVVSGDIDGMHNDLADARRAIDYEKKVNEELLEQNQAMEKNLLSLARETEKLPAEQLNAQWRARGYGGGDYGMCNGSLEFGYPGGSFGDGYGGSWGHYDRPGPRHR